MAYYTATLKDIVEALIGADEPIGYNDLYEATKALVYGNSAKYPNAEKMFSFLSEKDLNDTQQGKLARLFIYKYLTREICYETYGRWKTALLVEWAEKWDKWSRNFEVDELEKNIDPTISYKSSRWGDNRNKTESSADANGNSNSHSENRNSFSDTPQGKIDNVESDTYLTQYTKVVNDDNSSSVDHNESTSNGEGDFREQSEGTTMSYAKLLEEYRETSHADVEDFLAEFEDLFMRIF